MSGHARLPATPARPAPAGTLTPARPPRGKDQHPAVDPGRISARLAPPLATRERLAINDDDAARALLTRWLVHDLAPMLGLDPSTVRINTDAQAATNTEAHGASGLAGPQRIDLHPRRFQPATVEGRYLLAHELAHTAQRTLPADVSPIPAPLARRAAEDEAHSIGRAFATGHAVQRPQIALAADALAADTDTPALGDSVRTSRSREIALIARFLSGWWISDGDVNNIMEILDSVAYPVAKAMLMALEPPQRYALADNINEPHVLTHRRSVLAAYETLTSDQFGAVDLDVVRALKPDGMTSEEKQAAQSLLSNLGDKVRLKLLAENGGPGLRGIIATPQISEAERERMDKEAKQAVTDEARLADRRRAILAHAREGDSAKDLLDQARQKLTAHDHPDGSHSPTGADAVAVLDLLAGAGANPTRLAYLGERMEEEGLIDLMLQLLPASRYFDTRPHADTLGALVQSRLPWKNASLVEDLLSYGLFNWAITDDEALFAYNIIKSLPLSEQLRFRRRDSGKWYVRLLDNLPRTEDGKRRPGLEIRKADSAADLTRLEADGITVDKDTLLYNASEIYERKLATSGVDVLTRLVAAFEEARKGIYRDKEAMRLYAELVALGGSSLEPTKEHPADQLLREAVVRELDNLGYIDELFGELPEEFLYAEENRVSTVKIMLARDASRVQNHARELVSRGFTGWMVKDNEAWLAFMCVKALPEAERDDFIAQNPDLWGRIKGEMSAEQRQSRDLNAYIGDKAGVDRASVLGQLADQALWSADKLLTLDGLVHMAVAMTEHRFAFERSREFKAVKTPALEGLVEKYRLWNPAAGRDEYDPAKLQGTHWYDEGPFATLKTLGNGLVTLWNMDLLYVDGKVGAKVDLGNVQDMMGGDVSGAHLAAPAKKDKAAHPDANKLTVLMSADGKSAELILPELLIDTANMQFGGTTLQTGAVAIKDLRLHASYDSEDLGQATQAHAVLGSLVASDMLLASSGSMIAIATLALQTLRIASGAVDTVTGAATSNRKPGSVPFPLMVIPLLAMLMTIAVPIYLYKKITGYVDKFPGAVAQRTKALDFSFSSLSADGVTTSGGQQIERVAVTDFAVHVGLNKATRLRAERASIDQRLARMQGQTESKDASARLEARRSALEKELVIATGEEREYQDIQGQILKGGLSSAEQARLQKRLNELKFEEQGAAYIDIGAIEATGVSGTVTAKDPIRLSGIHGEGGGNALTDMMAMPTATDEELSRRSGAGERPAAPGSLGQSGGLLIELGNVSTGEVIVGGGLRTVASIDAQLKELESQKDAPQIVPLIESLHMLRKNAERFELMVQHGVSSLTPTQLDEFRALRLQLQAQADLIVKSISITRMTLDVDVASGRVKMGAEAASIAGVQMPAKGLEVDQVIVTGLGVGALPTGGLLNWADWKKNLSDAEGQVDYLTVSGVRDRMHGLLFEKATLTGAYAGIKNRGDEVTVGLKRMEVTGIGVVPRIGLLRQRLAGLEAKHKLAKGAQKAKLAAQIAKLTAKVAELDQLAQARVAAYQRLQAARTPAEVEAAKDAVAETDMTIVIGLAQYGASLVELDEFGVKISGAGDLLTDAFNGGIDPDKVLKHGASMKGLGPDGRLLKRFAIKGANIRDDKADARTEGSGDMELGETHLNIQAQRSGDTVTIDLAKLDIASFSLSEMLLTSDDAGVGMQIGSSGTSSIEGIHLDGEVRLVKRADVQGDGKFPADFRLSHVTVRNMRINRISANGLTYSSLPDKIEATIKSGAIGGIWIRDLTLDYPEGEGAKPVMLGSAGIDSITDLDVAGAIKGGMALQSGRLNGKSLQVDFLEEGALRASVGDLSATAMSLRGPDGWARFSLNHLSGTVTAKDGVYTLDAVKLGSLEVPAVHWRAGNRTIDGDKPARLIDLRVSAKVVTHKEKPDKPGAGEAEGKTVLDSVSVHDLYVGAVSAGHLLYQDGEQEVEIGAPDSTLPPEMQGFRPLYISDIHVENLEWDPAKGVGGNRMEVGVGGFEASAVYRNLKDGVRAGMALKGSKMGMSFIGPNFIVGNTGMIAKSAGFYRDKNVTSNFSTGQIFGSYTLTDKGVILNSIEVDQIALGRTTYGAPGVSVVLGGAGAAHLSISRVDMAFDKSVDAQGKQVKKLSNVSVGEIIMTGLHADQFRYVGKVVGASDKGVITTKETELIAAHAWIERLRIDTLKQDMASKLTTVARVAIDNPKGGGPAFGVQGLVANMATTIGSKVSATHIATDVEGSALYGQDISFQTIKVGDRTVNGKEEEVTRGAIGGKFQLDRLALLHPNIAMVDEKGQKTYVRSWGPKSGSKVVINGLAPRLYPNGTAVVPFSSLTAENFFIERGGMKAILPMLKIKDFALALKGGGSKDGFSVLAAKLGELSVNDVSFEMTVDRDKPAAPDDPASAAASPAFFAEPIGDMSGELRAEYNTLWDPNLKMPIRDGKLNFEDVHPYALNLSNGHLAIGRFRATEINVAEVPMKPGMHPEQGEYGVINFREMIEHIMNDKPTAKDKNAAPPDLSFLNDLKLGGHLQLGKGKIGAGANYAELEKGSSEGIPDNRIDIDWSKVGEDLPVSIHRLRAKSLHIGASDALPAGQTGEATVTGIRINVSGLAKMSFTINAFIKEGKIVDIQFGDISVFGQDAGSDYPAVSARPAPDLKAVSPDPAKAAP